MSKPRKPFKRKQRCGDLTGQRFNRLVALEYLPGWKGKKASWQCQCDCGKIKPISTSSLMNGSTKSCGCLNYEKRRAQTRLLIDIKGLTFTWLVAISYDRSKQKWLCRCKCGKTRLVASHKLRRGLIKSCGCGIFEESPEEKKEKARIHKRDTQYYHRDPEKGRRSGRRYYWKNRNKVLAKGKIYREKNPLLFQSWKRRYNTLEYQVQLVLRKAAAMRDKLIAAERKQHDNDCKDYGRPDPSS